MPFLPPPPVIKVNATRGSGANQNTLYISGNVDPKPPATFRYLIKFGSEDGITSVIGLTCYSDDQGNFAVQTGIKSLEFGHVQATTTDIYGSASNVGLSMRVNYGPPLVAIFSVTNLGSHAWEIQGTAISGGTLALSLAICHSTDVPSLDGADAFCTEGVIGAAKFDIQVTLVAGQNGNFTVTVTDILNQISNAAAGRIVGN